MPNHLLPQAQAGQRDVRKRQSHIHTQRVCGSKGRRRWEAEAGSGVVKETDCENETLLVTLMTEQQISHLESVWDADPPLPPCPHHSGV